MSYSIINSAKFIKNFNMIASHIQQTFNKIPQPAQLQAIETLAVDKKDLILIAKTEFEKSLIFNSISFLQEGVALIILPLNAIEEQQAENLLQVSNSVKCSSVILNEDSNTSKLWADIQNDCYSHDMCFCFSFNSSALIADSVSQF